jgi:hypothetical protein
MNKPGLLNVDPETLSTNGVTATGVIYFEHCGEYFPENGWSDFPVPILAWWLHELFSDANPTRLDFMDGPFTLEVRRNGKTASISGIERTAGADRITFVHETGIVDLQNSVINCARDVLRALETENISGPDHEDLKTAVCMCTAD